MIRNSQINNLKYKKVINTNLSSEKLVDIENIKLQQILRYSNKR